MHSATKSPLPSLVEWRSLPLYFFTALLLLLLTACYGSTRSFAAASLSSVAVSPTSVYGGASATGTVTLSAAAPSGGAVVALASSNTAAAPVPSSVTIASGSTTGTFTITSNLVNSSVSVTITATYASVSKTCTLAVNTPAANSVTLSPATVTVGSTSTGTVTLAGTAPSNGQAVTLSSSNTAAATVPSSVTVPSGSTSTTFTVSTSSSVAATTTVTISATASGRTQTATLTINPKPDFALSASPSTLSVTAGSSATSTVSLANSNGFTGSVALTASGVPSGVTAAFSPTSISGSTTSTLTLNASASAAAGSYTVIVTGTSGSLSHSQNLNLTVTAAASSPVPTLSLTSAVNGQVSLSWTTIASAASYNVYRSTTSGSGYTKIASGVTTTTYLDQGLTNNTSYYYCVTSVSSSGTESSKSNQVTAKPTAQAFGFLNIGNGATLSGEITAQISMASKGYGAEGNLVTFSIDGNQFDAGGDDQQSSGGSGANTFFVFNTDAFTNGSHTLKVSDANGNSATINVNFSNALSSVNVPTMFDTTGEDGLPTTGTISGTLTSAQSWTVSIITANADANTTVRSYSGNSSNISVAWDGKNSQGVEVDDGLYEVDITYGAAQSSSLVRTNAASATFTTKAMFSKNKIGDILLLLSQAVFPNVPNTRSSYDSILDYVKNIEKDLKPTKGIVWNTITIIVYTNRHATLTPAEVAHIDHHFQVPLKVFYVDSHGGPGFYSGTEFYIGGHYWESSSLSDKDHSLMPNLTADANYGVADPPALVFIDSCNSAGSSQSSPDLSFSNDFDIGDGGYGAFLGWSDEVVPYGLATAPYDDFSFWRLDLWSLFTNTSLTYDTAYSDLQRDYNTHGHNAYNANHIFVDQMQVTNWASGSSF